jgi:hypothetical protein
MATARCKLVPSSFPFFSPLNGHRHASVALQAYAKGRTKNAPFVHLSVYAVLRSAVQNDNCYIIGAGAHFCLSYQTTTTRAPGALVILAALHEQLQSVGPPRPPLEPVFRWAGPTRGRWWGRRTPAPETRNESRRCRKLLLEPDDAVPEKLPLLDVYKLVPEAVFRFPQSGVHQQPPGALVALYTGCGHRVVPLWSGPSEAATSRGSFLLSTPTFSHILY